MHRLILTSNTYRMSCQSNESALASDPENDLFWRFNMRRLTAEEILKNKPFPRKKVALDNGKKSA